MSEFRVTIEFRPGVLAPTFEAIAWAHDEEEAKRKALALAAECGWDQQIHRIRCVEVQA